MPIPKKKQRVSSYGLFVLDVSGRALRCWLDYRAGRVMSVPCVVPRGNVIWAYCLAVGKQSIVDDLVAAVVRAGYRCFAVDAARATTRLGDRYDVANPYPISQGETAGVKAPKGTGKAPVRRRRKDDGGGLFSAAQ